MFIAFAFDLISLGEAVPVWFRVVFGLLGALGIYGVFSHFRFLIKRRSALNGGRERSGKAQLRGKLTEESDSAMVIFSTAYDQWLLMLDANQVKEREAEMREGVSARAIIGEDDRIYALTIAGETVTLHCAGSPFEGTLRESIEAAEDRLAAQEEKQAKLAS